jgi:hypothetical protein
MIVYDKLDIGGRWTEPTDPPPLDIRSPHDRSLIGRAAQATTDDGLRCAGSRSVSWRGHPWNSPYSAALMKRTVRRLQGERYRP